MLDFDSKVFEHLWKIELGSHIDSYWSKFGGMRWWGYFAAQLLDLPATFQPGAGSHSPVIPTLPGFTWEYQQEFPKSLRFDDSCLGKCCFPQKMGGVIAPFHHYSFLNKWGFGELWDLDLWTSHLLKAASEVSLFAEVRQMDGHRASAWNKIAEDHRDWDAVEDHRWTLVPVA